MSAAGPGRRDAVPASAVEDAEPRDAGMGLVEVLVAMGLFAVVGTVLLGFALSTGNVSDATRRSANVNEEARLAMERLTRELRQANAILAVDLKGVDGATTTAITFWTDFDGNGAQDTNAADPEVLTYRWDPDTARLTLTANDPGGTAVTRPVLATAVSGFDLGLRSSLWEYDGRVTGTKDGATTWDELDRAGAPVGNGNNRPDDPELARIDLVTVAVTVRDGSNTRTYRAQTDLRNRSQS